MNILILSDANFLSLNLIEYLLSKSNKILLISSDAELWALKTPHVIENENFKIFSLQHLTNNLNKKFIESFGEILIISDVESSKDNFKNTTKDLRIYFKFLTILSITSQKKFLILPYWLYDFENELKIFTNFQKIYVGELYGPRMRLLGETIASGLISASLKGREVRLKNPNYYLILCFINSAVKKIFKIISGDPYVGDNILIGEYVTAGDFLNELLQDAEENEAPQFTGLRSTLNWLKKNFPKSLKEHKKNSLKHLPFDLNIVKKTTERKIFHKIPFPQKTFFLFFLIFSLLFFIPLIGVFTSLFMTNIAITSVKNGDFTKAEVYLESSGQIASFSNKISLPFIIVPLVGKPFSFFSETSNILAKIDKIGEKALALRPKLIELLNSVIKDQNSDISMLSIELNLQLDNIYSDLSFLQTEVGKLPYRFKRLSILTERTDEFRKILLVSSALAKRIPSLLGVDRPKTYLILFQNNMELRPTGGFIGSFSLLSFNKGKFIDNSVVDVYSADGQLKGHVEPPPEIKNYLGEANWYLRDANWDPDFPSSAQKIEWFLGKELGREVDGVIAIDMQVAKSVIAETGPIELKDFGLTIDHKNIYEKTQYEVESNFFPGSRKKETFLSALSKSLLLRVIDSGENNYLALLKILYSNLNSKHIQVYFHDPETQKIFSKEAWDGSLNAPTCGENCFVNWLQVVDANLGVNKANYFLERSLLLKSAIGNKSFENFLTVELFNNSSIAKENLSNRYKSFLRVIAPPGSIFRQVEVNSEGQKEKLEPFVKDLGTRVEAGVLLEVKPGYKKSVTFVWQLDHNLNMSRGGKEVFLWKKQAGTLEDPIKVSFIVPDNFRIIGKPGFSLTEGNGLGYNTTLVRDFEAEISW